MSLARLADDIYRNVYGRLRITAKLRWRLADSRAYRLFPMDAVDSSLALIDSAALAGALCQTRDLVAFLGKHRDRPDADVLWQSLESTTQTRGLELKRAITTGVYDADETRYPALDELRNFDPAHELVCHLALLNDPDRFDAFQDTPYFDAIFFDRYGTKINEMMWFVDRAPPLLAEHVRDKARRRCLNWPIDVLNKAAVVNLEGYAALKALGVSDERMARYLASAVSSANFAVSTAMTRDGYRLNGPRVQHTALEIQDDRHEEDYGPKDVRPEVDQTTDRVRIGNRAEVALNMIGIFLCVVFTACVAYTAVGASLWIAYGNEALA